LIEEVRFFAGARDGRQALIQLDVQLRPVGPSELLGLLHLCQIAVLPGMAPIPDQTYDTHSPKLSPTKSLTMTPSSSLHSHKHSFELANQTDGRFLKNRHAPFWNALSLLSKMSGVHSPIFWDMFCGCDHASRNRPDSNNAAAFRRYRWCHICFGEKRLAAPS
jgi:hypothetical protein